MRLLAVLLGCVVFAASAANADNDVNELEYRVKSAFIYNFTKFIDWPPAALGAEALRICISSGRGAPIVQETLAGKQAKQRLVDVRPIRQFSDLAGCHILYLDKDMRPRESWLQASAAMPLLTISDNGNFIDTGGMIQFVLVDGKIRFDINQYAIEKAGLSVSSKLLSVARRVDTRPGS